MASYNASHEQRQSRRLRTDVAVAMIPINEQARRISNPDNKISFFESKIEEISQRHPTTVNTALIEMIQLYIDRIRNPDPTNSVNEMISFRQQFNPNARGRSHKKRKGKNHKKSHHKSHKKRRAKSSRKK
jgi:hypothetical protein